MLTYQIQKCTLRCARSGRELQTGERFYSVLYDRGDTLVREDISQEAWQGPPEGAFSFWISKVPPKEQARRLHVDDEVLLDCFQRLTGEADPQKVRFRYVLALWLMRRKRLRFEDVRVDDGHEVLLLSCSRTRTRFEVLNPQLAEQQLAELQDEVLRLLT
jgi:hypothetical protein